MILFAAAAAFSVTGLMTGRSTPYAMGAMVAMLAVIVMLDYAAALRTTRGIGERALFFHWLQNSPTPRRCFVSWLAFLLVIGVLQLVGQHGFGDLEGLVTRLGAYFPALRKGEYWRLVLGPLMHDGLMHFVANAGNLLFAGTVATALLGRASVYTFVFGSSFGCAVEFWLARPPYDGYLGISAGVFALYGLLIAIGVRSRQGLPRGFGVLCTGIAALGIAVSAVTMPNAGTVAHFSGMSIGLLVGLSLLRQGCRKPRGLG